MTSENRFFTNEKLMPFRPRLDKQRVARRERQFDRGLDRELKRLSRP